ncbi:MAG: hypothetical protein IJS13_02425 [Paludibacteraceae bacterium]|nr:hypothetical protein [Paludibacteraceae bacterium]
MKPTFSCFKSIFAATLLASVMLTSCMADLDMQNIDNSAKVSMGLALPVGSITAKMTDFLTDTTIDKITLNAEGIYQFEDSFAFDKQFHPINLSNYFSSTTSELMMQQKVSETYPGIPVMPDGKTYITDPGTDIILDFPIGLKLSGVNTVLNNERLDKMSIESANFSSNFSQNFGLDFSRIKQLDIILPDNMPRSAGQTVNIPLSGQGYNTDIPIIVDNFDINLLKDPSKPYDQTTNTVTDSVTFVMRFTIHLNPGETLTLDDRSSFSYKFTVDFIDYSAIYGYFAASKEMRDSDEMKISEMWDFWNNLREITIPIAEPQLRLDITTGIAAPMHMHISYLEVEALKDHTTHRATFYGDPTKTSYDKDLPNYHTVYSPLETRSTNTVLFNNDNGNLSYIFEIRPDIVRYSYDFSPYEVTGVSQHRMTKDTKVDINAIVTIPFKLNEGTHLAFKDTVHAAMDSLSLQSLVSNVDAIDSIGVKNLKLVMTAQSYIPFDVKAQVHFLDKDGKDVGMTINEDNHLMILGPTDYDGSGNVNKPNDSQLVVDIDQDDLDKIAKAKEIAFDLDITDVDVSKLKDKGAVFPVSLGSETKLTIKVALSADADAYLRLPFGEQGGKKQ